MHLSKQPAHAGLVRSHQDKEIFNDEAALRVVVDDFHVRQSLLVGTYFVLTFHNEDTVGPQDAACFIGGLKVEFQYSVVVLFRDAVPGCVVGVVVLVVLMIDVCRPAGRVHVRWVEHDGVQRPGFIR
jgi:hypothetical protein